MTFFWYLNHSTTTTDGVNAARRLDGLDLI